MVVIWLIQDSRFVPSQLETALLCNDVSHWLGAAENSALFIWTSYECSIMCKLVGNLRYSPMKLYHWDLFAWEFHLAYHNYDVTCLIIVCTLILAMLHIVNIIIVQHILSWEIQFIILIISLPMFDWYLTFTTWSDQLKDKCNTDHIMIIKMVTILMIIIIIVII